MDTTATNHVDASADGKRNAFHHHCRIVGHGRNFAVCLHLINERKNGRLTVLYSDCSAAIGKGQCPAIDMRQKELESGKAIYFIERVRSLGEAFMTKAKELVSSASKTAGSKLRSSGKSSVIDLIDTGGYADAINAGYEALEKEHLGDPIVKTGIYAQVAVNGLEPPAPLKAEMDKSSVAGFSVMPGESLLEAARRALGKK